MSLERRKPLVLLHQNAGPTDAASATAYPSISRPRRQVPAYHHHLQQNPHKRYATMIPGSSRSSATSSAESLYSNASSMPRRRKLSAAADVAARVRARWATLEALERASGAPPPAESISATATATTHSRTSSRMNSHIPTRRRRSSEPPELEPGLLEKEKENAVPMQVDASGALSRSQSASARTPAVAMATTAAVVPMVVDSREDGYKNNGAAPHAAALQDANAGTGESVPASDSTLRTTPTSLTCFETDSLQPVLQRRPTRALTPPQVRRRPSVTDELEEAREEATLAMLQNQRTDGLLRCPRSGCDEVLGGVRALTFHLHIHSVETGAYTCARCGGAFESAKELTRHACAPRRARERFRSVVRAWTCLSSTSQSFGKKLQQQQQQRPLKHYKGKKDHSNYY
ncbi:hypothetical protein BJV74DRAFT_798116 [Russula compacta]|nr:hypothetical protein BJV74DRAFT_798116 [Russula compacta]